MGSRECAPAHLPFFSQECRQCLFLSIRGKVVTLVKKNFFSRNLDPASLLLSPPPFITQRSSFFAGGSSLFLQGKEMILVDEFSTSAVGQLYRAGEIAFCQEHFA